MSHYLFHLTFNETLRERNALIILQIGTLRLRAGSLPESPSSAGAARGSSPRPTWQRDCVPSPDSASPSIQRSSCPPQHCFLAWMPHVGLHRLGLATEWVLGITPVLSRVVPWLKNKDWGSKSSVQILGSNPAFLLTGCGISNYW